MADGDVAGLSESSAAQEGVAPQGRHDVNSGRWLQYAVVVRGDDAGRRRSSICQGKYLRGAAVGEDEWVAGLPGV